MLKYKTKVFDAAATGKEPLFGILAGMSGKNRRIVSISCSRVDLLYIRVYRDAEQIVDVLSTLLTDEAPFLPMDLPLAEGQLCNIGFWNNSGSTHTQTMCIGYEETG